MKRKRAALAGAVSAGFVLAGAAQQVDVNAQRVSSALAPAGASHVAIEAHGPAVINLPPGVVTVARLRTPSGQPFRPTPQRIRYGRQSVCQAVRFRQGRGESGTQQCVGPLLSAWPPPPGGLPAPTRRVHDNMVFFTSAPRDAGDVGGRMTWRDARSQLVQVVTPNR